MDGIRYNLDSLGWYQFEWLVQSLLKCELGIGIQSWGGHDDWGRDAYFPGSLRFPSKDSKEAGPFIFQAKFVAGASAAGAKPSVLLLDACRKEAKRIHERIAEGKWGEPKHYALLTNVPARTELRHSVEALFAEVTRATVTTLGGNDICDLLDNNPTIPRAFPQILSLRNLTELLDSIVNREAVQRSRAAVEAARNVIPVFVPTHAFNRAWNVVTKHHFAVLEGPPEMGKTAIAWMVAITQLANGWEAIACDEPADFFRSHRPEVQQVFVADDAFGRTEYDPTMGNKWEKQLERVMTAVDDRHWLLWTSRRHILERARREMDLQGSVSKFPQPGAVIVNAAELTREEKALILYRHSKNANYEHEVKRILKTHVKAIVENSSFTPERIRRFVTETLPILVSDRKCGKLDRKRLPLEINEAIRNPTDRMVKSFRALPLQYKWVLISLLEQGHSPDLGSLEEGFRRLYRSGTPIPFKRIVEELSEGFIRI